MTSSAGTGTGGGAGPAGRKALSRDVARQLEGWARSRRLVAGSKLPAERGLAPRLGASRNVLREALRILETRGVVEVRHGVGTFLAQQTAEGRVTIPVQLQLEASQLSVDEILVARRAIECAVVEVGTRNRDEFDLDEMQALLKVAAKAEASNDVDSFVKADLGFHELLGQCTHNQLLQEVQTQITRSTAAVRGIASTTHDAMGAALRYHAEIRDAFARGDGQAASAVMLLHLIDAGERALGALLDDASAGVHEAEAGDR